MDKLIITRWKSKVLTAVFTDGKAVSLTLEPENSSSLLNNIYIGRVQKVVSNIGAAFIEIGGGQIGYYSLEENRPVILNRPGARKLNPGDELIVQVSKDAVKTKAPVLTGRLTFTGRYCVLTPHKAGVNFSSKLSDPALKRRLKPLLEEAAASLGYVDGGLIVRTNAAGADPEDVLAELNSLFLIYRRVLDESGHRTCYSCLYRSLPGYIASLRDAYTGCLESIVTDQADYYQELGQYLRDHQKEDLGRLSFYNDPMVGLSKVYSLEKMMEAALSPRVWLKSGGYLVIEPTEAMVVIDVNTGKYSGKKTLQETILKINLEAAEEIGRQLRLRNLSGIIIVDFIDLEKVEDREYLIRQLTEVTARDPIKTTVVEMTKLNLVEMTRKKVRRPLHEQVVSNSDEN